MWLVEATLICTLSCMMSSCRLCVIVILWLTAFSLSNSLHPVHSLCLINSIRGHLLTSRHKTLLCSKGCSAEVECHIFFNFSFTTVLLCPYSNVVLFDQGNKLRREILQLVRDLPSTYDDISRRIQTLSAAVQYYAEFVSFLLSRWVLWSVLAYFSLLHGEYLWVPLSFSAVCTGQLTSACNSQTMCEYFYLWYKYSILYFFV